MHAFSTRRTVLAGGAATLALVGAPAAAQAPNRNPKLAAYLDNELARDILRQRPQRATSLAISEAQAGGPYQDRLADVSRAGQAAYLDLAERALPRLESFKNGASPQDLATIGTVSFGFEIAKASKAFNYGNIINPYIVTQSSGAYTNIPDFLSSQHPLRTPADVDAYLSRLSAFARVLNQETQRIREDAANGVIPPDFVIDGAIKQLQGFAAMKAGDTVLVKSLQQRLPKVPGLSETARLNTLSRAESIVAQQVLPAYRAQVAEFQRLRPRAANAAGVWRLPRGDEFYALALRNFTTTNMSPDEVHELGQKLVKELNAEMDKVLRSMGRTQGSVAQRIQALSKDPDQLYPNTDAGRAVLLADLNKQMRALDPVLPKYFGRMPKAAVEIKRVPEYIEAGAPGGYYQSPALDGSRPGFYYINLRNTAEWPKFTLPTLTYHEANPGHHWQISLAQETPGLTLMQRALTGFSSFSEGWALYGEQLMDEAGVYANDPAGRVGYLQSAAFRAARLVVDTGLHHKRWTREQSIDWMVEATGDQRSSITTEIERYCVWPGQACSYMVGREKMLQLRAEARSALGARFDIRGFHDAVLAEGSPPLTVVEDIVTRWVNSRRV